MNRRTSPWLWLGAALWALSVLNVANQAAHLTNDSSGPCGPGETPESIHTDASGVECVILDPARLGALRSLSDSLRASDDGRDIILP